MDNDDRQYELLKIYIKNMKRVKWRVQAIQDVIYGIRTTTYDFTDVEFCILQYRKVFELIALSSLVSDADVYKENLGNIEKMWNAEFIIKDIERIHPYFFPVAVRTNPNDRIDRAKWLSPTEPCLTKEQLIKAYAKCDRFLHEASPFVSNKQIYNEYYAIWEDIHKWEELVINLLGVHNVFLYSSDCLFHINMGGPDINSLPVGCVMEKVSEDEFFFDK